MSGLVFAVTCTLVPESSYDDPDSVLLPELTAAGLVLWRLRVPDHQLWCTVEDSVGQLTLRVHDPGTGQTAVAETHTTIAAVVTRAHELRVQFVADGWIVVDVDLDDPDESP